MLRATIFIHFWLLPCAPQADWRQRFWKCRNGKDWNFHIQPNGPLDHRYPNGVVLTYPSLSIAIHHSKPFWCIQQPPGSAKTPPSVAKASSRGDQQIQHRFFQLVGPRSIPNPVIPCDNSDTAEDTQSHATAQSFTWQRGDLTLNSFGANAQGYKTNLFIPSFNQTCLGSEKSSIYLSIKIIFSKKWCWCWYSCQPWLFNIIQTAPLFFGIFRNPGDHRGCGWDHASLKRSSASPYSPSGEPWGRPDAAGASFWMENQWQPMVEPLIQYQLMYVNV